MMQKKHLWSWKQQKAWLLPHQMFPGIRMEKNSAGLGACSWEQGPCQFLRPCCHCKGKQGNAFKGILHDAIASFLRFGRQRPC